MLYSCIRCSATYKAKPRAKRRYCSRDCYSAVRLERVHIPCGTCGRVFKSRPSTGQRYCSKKCGGVAQQGRAGTARKVIKCERCKKQVERTASQASYSRFCSRRCRALTLSVGKHIGIKAVHRQTPRKHYERPYYQKQAARTRARDNYTCQHCRKEFAKGERGLEVHHLKPVRLGGSDHLSNLLSLCMKCHRRADHRIRQIEMLSHGHDGQLIAYRQGKLF